MSLKKHIPNFITLLNLFSGVVALLFASINQLEIAAYFVVLGIVFDYFDGFAARILKVQGELGKQLDSLADMVTSGVVPGIVMFQLFLKSQHNNWIDGLSCEVGNWTLFEDTANLSLSGIKIHLLPFTGLLLILAAAYRLANFNIDERQTTSFIGLPTPAMSLFVLSLPLILNHNDNEFIKDLILNKYFLIAITLLLSVLMNANLKLFSLKFKTYSLRDNGLKYAFLVSSIVLLLVFQYLAVPLIIMSYIIVSLLDNLLSKKSV